MTKRKWIEADEERSPNSAKKRRSDYDRLSSLSDELVLRTLSFLPVASLATCQRLVSTCLSKPTFLLIFFY